MFQNDRISGCGKSGEHDAFDGSGEWSENEGLNDFGRHCEKDAVDSCCQYEEKIGISGTDACSEWLRLTLQSDVSNDRG